MARPKLPFVDWDACTFEGCIYREWTARRPITVDNTWKANRRPIARLGIKNTVIGLSGAVITFQPGIIRMDRDSHGLKNGDIILTYTYRGEGTSAVWLHGKYYPNYDISFTKWPDGAGCGGHYCAATYLNLGKKVGGLKWSFHLEIPVGETPAG